jgi:hypothetical protein
MVDRGFVQTSVRCHTHHGTRIQCNLFYGPGGNETDGENISLYWIFLILVSKKQIRFNKHVMAHQINVKSQKQLLDHMSIFYIISYLLRYSLRIKLTNYNPSVSYLEN